jgi:hypothetical protein
MPAQVREAHRHSIHHKGEIENSVRCGCFYCMSLFAPSEIVEWVDENDTALCPEFGIDSVIPDASGFPVTREFLEEMNRHWF